MNDIDQAIAQFVDQKQKALRAYYASFGSFTTPVLSVESGRRYARIVKTVGASRDALYFVDMATGKVHEAKSYRSPKPWSCANVFA